MLYVQGIYHPLLVKLTMTHRSYILKLQITLNIDFCARTICTTYVF